MRRTTAVTALALVSGLVLAGCGGSSGGSASSTTSSAAPSASGSAGASATPCTPTAAAAAPAGAKTTKVGVAVSGAADKKPTLTIPRSAAPTTTSVEVLAAGTGAVVKKGDVLLANYLGQTWAEKDCKVNVFDNSYDRGAVAGFPIGVGAVVKGWDSTLVGQKLGSRVLLTITPQDGYGVKDAQSTSELAGETLVFVVDLKDTIKGDGVAKGAVEKVPAGFPAITSESGKRPDVTSVTGVKTSATPASALLVKGTGPAIDEKKQLVLQFLQTDAKTGKQTQKTWDAGQPQVVAATSVLSLVTALKGQPVGSRAVVVTAEEASSPAQVLVVDVIGQF
ncbi:FKBP-type peptidyl-prolyl cis-trans isomerase [Kineosporia sp. A_224]|uniref:FKBP-type peptidyl-prolyl cis-trans isomerase n=1 Tax=Kineosporia sp. A_224 TaxID=1962180 RepID=UPI000B4B69F1|nr:FKBP-type peptidyl-prolyl cis-trans isomerase [Kineosporia sp. A_224]